jgi:hypothetical protein
MLIDAFVRVSKEGGNRFDFVGSDSVVDGIFERSAPAFGFLMVLHLIIKDYCQGIAAIMNNKSCS